MKRLFVREFVKLFGLLEEKLGENPLILLDGAHNVHAMNRLLENLGKEFPDKKITIIFSAITTKDIRQMIKCFKR